MKALRIALVGYGQMGQAIAGLAEQTGHRITHRIRSENAADLQAVTATSCDVAIEFTRPGVVFQNLQTLLAAGVPVVVGTTGWYAHQDAVHRQALQAGVPVVWGSNFSIGVNLLFRLNELLAEWMNAHPQFDPYLEERHHIRKQDGPSGTAHTLLEGLLKHLDRKTKVAPAVELAKRSIAADELSVAFTRAGGIKGLHRVAYTSEVERLTLEHEAFSRDGFAQGALYAAEKLLSLSPGLHAFPDLLG